MNNKIPKKSFSEDNMNKCNKLFGVYPQKQDGLFMQRIKILGGRINWTQWRKIAYLANKYSKSTPLHLTTRQNIELHNLDIDNIPLIQNSLTEVALTTFGSGGDSIRNVTICPACDMCNNGLDLFPLAEQIQRCIVKYTDISNLPRKFKISFSCCEKACAKPWLSDLGFIAKENGALKVIGAGSLGAKPELGIVLYESLTIRDILPLCVASVNLFKKYGDYENRHRARFRHIRIKLGDKKFKEVLNDHFNKLKSNPCWPKINLVSSTNKKNKLLYRLQLPNGNVNAQKAIELANTAEPSGAILRINLEHGLEIYGEKSIQLPKSLIGFVSKPIIIACPGSTTCSKALIDCWATADKLREALSGNALPGLSISISGCPNNCAQSAVADIGLTGVIRKEGEIKVNSYKLFKGGGNGKTEKLAEQTNFIRNTELPEIIRQIIDKN